MNSFYIAKRMFNFPCDSHSLPAGVLEDKRQCNLL